jgi:L-amino acid N-acyltransferase YncA
MTELLDELAEAREAWTSPAIASWYSPEALRRQWRTAMQAEAERLGDAVFGEGFRHDVGHGPTDPLAWANRRLELADGGWVLTGIRYRNRDVSRPFVDIIATTASATPDGLAALVEGVLPAYADFAPLSLRVDAPDPLALVEELGVDPRFGAGCAVDMLVVAETVQRLRAHPRAAAYPDVSLRAGEAERLARRVAEIYAELGAGEPALATWAQPEDAESLADCADEGLLFEVLAEGEAAGVVAGLRYDAHGMRGFSVQEICLASAHRGRRRAPAVLQRLVDALPDQDGDVLWGTIDPANAASLNNARAIGRRVVGGLVWITPRGLPGMRPGSSGT